MVLKLGEVVSEKITIRPRNPLTNFGGIATNPQGRNMKVHEGIGEEIMRQSRLFLA